MKTYRPKEAEKSLAELKLIYGSVALQQALRAKGLSYQQVADLMQVSKRTAWNNCNGVYGCFRWEERSNQKELLFIAEIIILKGGKNE